MLSRRKCAHFIIWALIPAISSYGQKSYVYEFHVGKGPSYDFNRINDAIAQMTKLDPKGEASKCIYIHPGQYWEQLNDVYNGAATNHHETNGHNVPARCDLIGVGGTSEEIVILHYSGYNKTDRTYVERICRPGVVCNGNNVLADLSIVNANLSLAQQKPDGVSEEWGWVQNSVEFYGPGKLKNCVVSSGHQAVNSKASLEVTNCQVTSHFLSCINVQGNFCISDSVLYPQSDPLNMEWPSGVYISTSGIIRNVVISSECLFEQSVGDTSSLSGVTLDMRDDSALVRISDTRVELSLTSRSQEQIDLGVFGICTTPYCRGRIVIQDCNIVVTGHNEGVADINVAGVYVDSGSVEVWGRTSIDVVKDGSTIVSPTYALRNNGSVLARDPDPRQVVYDRSKEFGTITDLTRVRNLSQGYAYTSIRESIERASPNDVIELSAGVHHESVVVVGKPLQIIGIVDPEKSGIIGNTIIDADKTANAVLFGDGSTGSVLSGLVIRNGICGILCERSACAIRNCWIYSNVHGVFFSGVSLESELRNNTIVHNSDCGIFADSGTAPQVSNCILWQNGDDLRRCSATYSCIKDGDSGLGNIHIDPCLVDFGNDYHLQVDSPCVDAGDPASAQEGVDIDGDDRVLGAAADIGADEVHVRARNVSQNKNYLRIEDAIDRADTGDTIVIAVGEHYAHIDLTSRTLTIRSIDPNNPDVVRSTVLLPTPGAPNTVLFSSEGSHPAVLSGITIRGHQISVSCLNHANPTIDRCLIEGASRCGLFSDLSSPLIQNCRITNDGSFGLLASRSQLVVKNSWIYGNATGVLSGIGTINSLTVKNCSVCCNGTGVRLDDGSAIIANCVFWKNSVDLSGCRATYSCITDTGNAGEPGNISCDPQFVAPDSNDFHLQVSSLCIDAGAPGHIPWENETDIDGDPRIVHGRLDMGADEVTFVPEANLVISGYVRNPDGSPISDVVIMFSDCNEHTITDANGYYCKTVLCGWPGIVTPTKAGYRFDPASRSYSNIVGNEPQQDYVSEIYYPQPPSDALSKSLCTGLLFTTGGDAKWFAQGETTYDGVSAQSGHISALKTSWVETVVYGVGVVQFYWKVSSEQDFDFLEFYIDGIRKGYISGEVNWYKQEYMIGTFGPHTLRWRYVKDGGGNRGCDSAWVDKVVWESSNATPPSGPLEEALDTNLTLTTGGNANWISHNTTSYYGGDAAQSGNINNSQESWLQTIVNGPGIIRFFWKVSSEESRDFLEFYIGDTLIAWISGEVNWCQQEFMMSTSTSHILRWRYVKDESGQSGSDHGWVDKIEWQPTPP